MKLIHKNSEPNILLQYRLSANSCYSNLPGNIKKEIKESLLKEQNYLCAYCTSKINIDNMKIEHYIAQSTDRSRDLKYDNMLAVCKGGEDKNYGSNCLTCDSSKKNKSLDNLDPLKQSSIDNLVVSNQGEVKPLNSLSIQRKNDINYEIEDILNLNIELFKQNRKKTYTTTINNLKKRRNATLKRGGVIKALSILTKTPFSELAEQKLRKKL